MFSRFINDIAEKISNNKIITMLRNVFHHDTPKPFDEVPDTIVFEFEEIEEPTDMFAGLYTYGLTFSEVSVSRKREAPKKRVHKKNHGKVIRKH